MKFKNWLMSKLLSPGAYATWHAMGNPDEWEEHGSDRGWLRHKQAGLAFGSGGDAPFRWMAALVAPFFFDGHPAYQGHCIGLLERHLVYLRAHRLVNELRRRERTKIFREANQKVFTLLLINEDPH